MSKSKMIKHCQLGREKKPVKGGRRCLGGGRKLLFLSLVGVLVAGGMYYLQIMNSKAGLGFKAADLEAKLSDLREENKNLEVESSELQGVARVQAEATRLGLVNAGGVEYLVDKEAGLARR